MTGGPGPVPDPVPPRLRGGIPCSRTLELFRPTGELREREDRSTGRLFTGAEYEFEPTGVLRCRAEDVRLTGRWQWHPAESVVEVEATSAEGHTLDGLITQDGTSAEGSVPIRTGGCLRLEALYLGPARLDPTVSRVSQDLRAVPYRAPDPQTAPTTLDPRIEAVLKSVDDRIGTISRDLDLPDDTDDGWGAFPLDVLLPEFDVTIAPADGFPSGLQYAGTLFFSRAGDRHHFTVLLVCHGQVGTGWLAWETRKIADTAFTADGALTFSDDREHQGIGPERLTWYPGPAAEPIALVRSRIRLRFDPGTLGVTGQVSAVGTDGGLRVARIDGVLRGRDTEVLRRALAVPSLVGRWSAVAGPLPGLVVPRTDAAPAPTRMTPRLPSGRAFVRLAVGQDLAVGLALVGGEHVPVVLRRTETAAAMIAEACDRSSLGFLAKDLAVAGRHATAAPLLRRTAQLHWAATGTDPDSTTGDLIGLISLTNHLVVGAFALRDYPMLLEHLGQAVRIRRLLADEPHVLSSFLRTCRSQATHLGTAADLFTGLASMAREHLSRAPAPLEGLTRLASVLETGARACTEAALQFRTAADGATETGIRPSPRARSDLQHTIVVLQQGLCRLGGALRHEADFLLVPNEAVLGTVEELVTERRLLCHRSVSSTDSRSVSGDVPCEDPDASAEDHDAWERRLTDLRTREERMLEAIDSDDRLAPPLRGLFRMEYMAAGRMLCEAVELERRAWDLDRWEIAEGVHRTRADTAPAVAHLARYVERWRALLNRDRERIVEDLEKIAAVQHAVPVFAGLVALLTDLGAEWDALVAGEQGRARASADLLRRQGTSPQGLGDVAGAPGLDRAVLERIVHEHGRPVVEYFLHEERLTVWTISPDGHLSTAVVPVVPEELDSLVQCLHDLAELTSTDASGLREVLRELHRRLWDPVDTTLLGERGSAVTVVPHDLTFRVPFPALIDAEGRPLASEHAISLVPSLAVLDELLARPTATARCPPSPRLLALVNPKMPRPPQGTSFPALAVTEACFPRIAQLFTGRPGAAEPTVRYGAAADLPTLEQSAGGTDVLVLATHADASDSQSPGQGSYIALAPSARHSGLVRPNDLLGLRLRAATVVLSACRTGGGTITGDGVIGMSRAFLAAGASKLILTLFRIGERTSMEFLYRFLEGWLPGDRTAAQAFRAAQVSLIEEYPDDPRQWLGFVLWGAGA